jgi:hypothetical protein
MNVGLTRLRKGPGNVWAGKCHRSLKQTEFWRKWSQIFSFFFTIVKMLYFTCVFIVSVGKITPAQIEFCERRIYGQRF